MRATRATWNRKTVGVTFLAFTLAAASGCSSGAPAPVLDVWTGIGIEITALYGGSEGFWWQDADLWSSQAVGVITVSGSQMIAKGGMCGHPRYGNCTATFSPPVVSVSLPVFDAQPLVYHLERVNGALEVRDAGDAMIVTLRPRPMGADILSSDGHIFAVADWDESEAHKLWVSTANDGALLGWAVGAVPPEIGALGQGGRFDAPGHAVALAAALTWLR
jgi:hypothetical protein